MAELEKTADLDEIRKKMPDNYASLIAEEMDDEDFSKETVRNIFRKRITRQEKVIKVLTAAVIVIEKQKQINDLTKNIASQLA